MPSGPVIPNMVLHRRSSMRSSDIRQCRVTSERGGPQQDLEVHHIINDDLEICGVGCIPAACTSYGRAKSIGQIGRESVDDLRCGGIRRVALEVRARLQVMRKRTNIFSSSMYGKLKKPTSCPTVLVVVSGARAALVARPRLSQSAASRPVPPVLPQSVLRVFRAYKVAGKNPEVHVSGGKRLQSPAAVVHWGY